MGKLGKKFYKRTYTKNIRGLVLFREKKSFHVACCMSTALVNISTCSFVARITGSQCFQTVAWSIHRKEIPHQMCVLSQIVFWKIQVTLRYASENCFQFIRFRMATFKME